MRDVNKRSASALFLNSPTALRLSVCCSVFTVFDCTARDRFKKKTYVHPSFSPLSWQCMTCLVFPFRQDRDLSDLCTQFPSHLFCTFHLATISRTLNCARASWLPQQYCVFGIAMTSSSTWSLLIIKAKVVNSSSLFPV